FSLFLRPISPHDVRLYALRDEIECSKRFYLSRKKAKKRRSKNAKPPLHLFISFQLTTDEKAQTEYPQIQEQIIENRSCCSVGVYRSGF
ncbi:MAG: hypothetical protein ACLTTQ_06220, partial [Christensenellales bacterium]